MSSMLRRLPPLLVAALLAAACSGGEASPLVERLTVAAAMPPPRPTTAPQPPPPVSASALMVTGDVNITDTNPEVMVAPLTAAKLRLELRHREHGSSQPDSVLVFFNVPPRPGLYSVHSPEDPPVVGRVYAFFTSRGNAVGSMKDFNTAVTGTLRLHREAGALAGSFEVWAQEPPPRLPPPPRPGQPPPRPVVGNLPPVPPAKVQATGTLLALIPAGAEVEAADAAQGPPRTGDGTP
jgi:hypothetical protein